METQPLSCGKDFLNQLAGSRTYPNEQVSSMDGKILIIDDVATNRIVFKVKLGAASYNPVMASGGVEGLRTARRERPDLILLDLNLPDLPGVEVLRRLREDALTRHIPVIVVSSSTQESDRIEALEAGADDVFGKPYDDQLLLSRVRNLLRSRQEIADMQSGREGASLGMAEAPAEIELPGVIAVVSARPESTVRLRRDLAQRMRDRIVLVPPHEALSDISPDRGAADIYLIDGEGMTTTRILRLVSDLRSRASTRHSGICVMTDSVEASDAMMTFDLGANEIVAPSMSAHEVALRLRLILRAKRRADSARATVQDGLRLAMVDPLTGLHNRRYAMARLAAVARTARDEGSTFAVMIADIDRFKSVNDRHGHAAGDAVLVEVAQRLQTDLRASDLLARIGGEEFLIVLPRTTLEEATDVAERLRARIAARPLTLPSGEAIGLTISIGLALRNCTPDGGVQDNLSDCTDETVELADRALLESKTRGRDTITVGRSAA
jgi:two-component system cell cycle response regulator